MKCQNIINNYYVYANENNIKYNVYMNINNLHYKNIKSLNYNVLTSQYSINKENTEKYVDKMYIIVNNFLFRNFLKLFFSLYKVNIHMIILNQ